MPQSLDIPAIAIIPQKRRDPSTCCFNGQGSLELKIADFLEEYSRRCSYGMRVVNIEKTTFKYK